MGETPWRGAGRNLNEWWGVEYYRAGVRGIYLGMSIFIFSA